MPYTNVKTPSFYISTLDWLQSVGRVKYKDDMLNDIHLLNPSAIHRIAPEENWWQTSEINYDIEMAYSHIPYSHFADDDGYVYLFILGHNLYSKDCSMVIQTIDSSGNVYEPSSSEGIVNFQDSNTPPEFNGWSLIKLKYPDIAIDKIRMKIRGFSALSDYEDSSGVNIGEIKLGCISLCTKFTTSHSPDVKLSMSRTFDGVKNKKTKSGSTISNAMSVRGGDYWQISHPWELRRGDYDIRDGGITRQGFSRTLGRKSWKLNFSYLDDSDIMPEIETLDPYETEYDDSHNINIQGSNSFLSLINKTQGNHLPFIFQSDNSSTNPDQFSICRFKQNKFSYKQVAPQIYNFDINLEESW